MRTVVFVVFLMTLNMTLFGQKITYGIPKGYERKISKADYKQLVDLSVPIVAKRYSIDYVKNGTIQLTGGQEMQAINLHNLIIKCAALDDPSLWDEMVQDHFEKIFSSIDEKKKIDLANFETVTKYISLRIYPASVLEQRGALEQMVTKTDLEDTYTVLMLDLPGAFSSVSKQVFELWKQDEITVFNIAQENINKQSIEKITQQYDIDGAEIEITFLGNEDYAASYALDLMNNSPELVGEWGAVVAIPNKGIVGICKISKDNPVDFVKFIQATKLSIENAYVEHEQRISDQFFWYYKGKFTRISVVTGPDGSISVISPFGLSVLMTEQK